MRATPEQASSVVAEYDALEQFDRDQRYIDEHYEELWKRYPNCWIAIHQGKLIAFASNIATLLERIEDQGVRGEDVARRRLTKEAGLIL